MALQELCHCRTRPALAESFEIKVPAISVEMPATTSKTVHTHYNGTLTCGRAAYAMYWKQLASCAGGSVFHHVTIIPNLVRFCTKLKKVSKVTRHPRIGTAYQ